MTIRRGFAAISGPASKASTSAISRRVLFGCVVTSMRPNRRVTGHHALSGSDQAITACDDSLATSAISCASITPFNAFGPRASDLRALSKKSLGAASNRFWPMKAPSRG